MRKEMERSLPRIKRERLTIQKMISLYCQQHHQPQDGRLLCYECQELEDYALERLQRCPFKERKTTCAKCPIHCYKPAMREKVRQVMRYAGPRMITRHPVLAVCHLIDGLRKPTRLKR